MEGMFAAKWTTQNTDRSEIESINQNRGMKKEIIFWKKIMMWDAPTSMVYHFRIDWVLLWRLSKMVKMGGNVKKRPIDDEYRGMK